MRLRLARTNTPCTHTRDRAAFLHRCRLGGSQKLAAMALRVPVHLAGTTPRIGTGGQISSGMDVERDGPPMGVHALARAATVGGPHVEPRDAHWSVKKGHWKTDGTAESRFGPLSHGRNWFSTKNVSCTADEPPGRGLPGTTPDDRAGRRPPRRPTPLCVSPYRMACFPVLNVCDRGDERKARAGLAAAALAMPPRPVASASCRVWRRQRPVRPLGRLPIATTRSPSGHIHGNSSSSGSSGSCGHIVVGNHGCVQVPAESPAPCGAWRKRGHTATWPRPRRRWRLWERFATAAVAAAAVVAVDIAQRRPSMALFARLPAPAHVNQRKHPRLAVPWDGDTEGSTAMPLRQTEIPPCGRAGAIRRTPAWRRLHRHSQRAHASCRRTRLTRHRHPARRRGGRADGGGTGGGAAAPPPTGELTARARGGRTIPYTRCRATAARPPRVAQTSGGMVGGAAA